MTETISPQQFHDAGGIEDWRVLTNVAHAHFRTGSFAEGVALVGSIGRLADAANHYPEVDLRPDGVTARLTTTTPDHLFWLSERDVELARQISATARELGVRADPTAVQSVQLTIDALVHPDVMPFWRAVLGYRKVGDEDLLDPRSQGPPIWFQQMDAPRQQRNRIHIDVWIPQASTLSAASASAGETIPGTSPPLRLVYPRCSPGIERRNRLMGSR
ncbi:MAG: 4a-hydroxytetrahydrobiopterin dehydratase [Actinomycetota bacterium]